MVISQSSSISYCQWSTDSTHSIIKSFSLWHTCSGDRCTASMTWVGAGALSSSACAAAETNFFCTEIHLRLKENTLVFSPFHPSGLASPTAYYGSLVIFFLLCAKKEWLPYSAVNKCRNHQRSNSENLVQTKLEPWFWHETNYDPNMMPSIDVGSGDLINIVNVADMCLDDKVCQCMHILSRYFKAKASVFSPTSALNSTRTDLACWVTSQTLSNKHIGSVPKCLPYPQLIPVSLLLAASLRSRWRRASTGIWSAATT